MSRKSRNAQKQREQMKMIIVIMAAVLIGLAALLIGIASISDTGGHNHDHDAKVSLRVCIAADEGENHITSIEQFKKEVEEKSDGDIQVTISNAEKGKTGKDLVSSLQKDEVDVDIVVTDVANFTSIDERMDISSLPFIFDSYEDAWAFMDGDIQEAIEEELLDENIRVLTHYSDGFEYMTTATESVMSVQDIQNMRFVASSNSPIHKIMPVFGANSMEGEVDMISQLLAGGGADGYFGKLEDIMQNHLYQNQHFLAVTYHSYHAEAFVISEKTWKTISEEHQKIIKNAAENSAYSDRKNSQENEKGLLKSLESLGMRVTYPNLAGFSSKVESVLTSYESKYGVWINEIIKNMKR